MRLFLAVPVAGNDLFPEVFSVSRALVHTLAVSTFHDKFFHARYRNLFICTKRIYIYIYFFKKYSIKYFLIKRFKLSLQEFNINFRTSMRNDDKIRE